MRIGLIVPGFSASEEDWCIPALLNLARSLAQRHQVQVFALRYPHDRQRYSVYGANVHALGGSGGLGRLRLLAGTLVLILGEHRRARFDILHGLWADEPGSLAVIGGRLLRVPSLVSLMGGELVGHPDIGYGGQLSPVNRSLTRLALRGAGRVTAGSGSLCGVAGAQVSEERVALLPLGVDSEAFHPEAGSGGAPRLTEGRIKLLHVGSLVPVKDQTTLLRAFRLACGELPGAHLHIVGDGPLRRDLGAFAASLGMERRVTFHGAVRHEDMPGYYTAAELCVLSSRYESQGMVVLEAAACGRATVGTAVGVLPDLVPAARVVPVGDSRGLADVLVDVLTSPETMADMGRSSRKAVEAGYTLRQTVARLEAVYYDLSATDST